jgi:hypothetical protein
VLHALGALSVVTWNLRPTWRSGQLLGGNRQSPDIDRWSEPFGGCFRTHFTLLGRLWRDTRPTVTCWRVTIHYPSAHSHHELTRSWRGTYSDTTPLTGEPVVTNHCGLFASSAGRPVSPPRAEVLVPGGRRRGWGGSNGSDAPATAHGAVLQHNQSGPHTHPHLPYQTKSATPVHTHPHLSRHPNQQQTPQYIHTHTFLLPKPEKTP